MKKQISILIIDDDEQYAKEFVSYAKMQDYVLDAYYSSDGQQGFDTVIMTSPDIIVLDTFMPHLDGLGVLRKLKTVNLKSKPIIIMNSEANFSSLINTALQNGADYFMLKPQLHSEICQTAFDLFFTEPAHKPILKEQNSDLEKSVTVFLHSLGMPSHLDGYKYMRLAMMKTIDNVDLLNPITKKLYPMIADAFKTTKECVERAMRHAISVSWQRGNKKQIKDIFGYTIDTTGSHCPTNSEYIAMTTDDFRLRLKHGMIE